MKIEDQINEATATYVAALKPLAEDPHLRAAIAKMAIRDLCWALIEEMDISGFDIEEDLQTMADVVKEHALRDAKGDFPETSRNDN